MKNNYRFHSDAHPVAPCTSHIRGCRQETTQPGTHSFYFKHGPSKTSWCCFPLIYYQKTWALGLDFSCFCALWPFLISAII